MFIINLLIDIWMNFEWTNVTNVNEQCEFLERDWKVNKFSSNLHCFYFKKHLKFILNCF